MNPEEPEKKETAVENVLHQALYEYVKGQAEERKSKKWRWRFIIASMLVYMGVNVFFMVSSGSFKPKPQSYAAMVRVDGPIAVGKMASTAVLFPVLEKAFEDTKAACVALVINSPGGMVGQSQMLHERILKLAKKHNKKVVAIGEDMMASGGYMIAASASRIYAPTTAAVGSIGVRMDGYDLTGIAEKLGIKDRTLTAGNMKDSVNPLKPMSEQAAKKVEHDLQQIHSEFIRIVKGARGERLKRPDAEVFTGEVFTGMDGVAIGLLDGSLDLEDAVKTDCGVDSVVAFEPNIGFGDILSFINAR